ncbi:uncharacterized protein [Danio rerio]|uniref:Uncharacterized protein n=1 Tax=Danio rerio TaxID=7955 RepID=A0AC58JEU0_DANRE
MASKSCFPYFRAEPIIVQCIGHRTTASSVDFSIKDGQICKGAQRIVHLSVVANNEKTYMVPWNSPEAPFQEGLTYVIKNYTTSCKYGQDRLFISAKSTIFRTAPLDLAESVTNAALQILHPPSIHLTGGEHDLYTRGGYLTLKGTIKNLQVPRMAMVQSSEVPILDFVLQCGQNTFDVSLWRDTALEELQLNSEVTVTHLKAVVRRDGSRKLNSSAYTRIEIADQGQTAKNIKVIGLHESDEELTLLLEDFSELKASAKLFELSGDELISQLPFIAEVTEQLGKVIEIKRLIFNEV